MKVTILTTGGTISKTYDEHEGALRNVRSVLDEILANLRLPDLFVRHVAVMNKDSLDMNDHDRHVIAAAVQESLPISDAIVLLHGTDTLSHTGEVIYAEVSDTGIPIVLTGAMRPYEFRDSDALQNVTEALLAARFMDPGVYVAMHNRVLAFPGVEKDRRALTFRRTEDAAE